MEENNKGFKILIGGIIGLLVIVVVVVGILAFSLQKNSIYKDDNQIKASDVLTKTGKNIYYYYQPTCAHCEEMKPDVTKFASLVDGKIKFNVIDAAADENSDVWYQSDKYTNASEDPNWKNTPDTIKSNADIKIAGTPTMIYADGEKVISVNMGTGIYDVMNAALKDVGIDQTIENTTAS